MMFYNKNNETINLEKDINNSIQLFLNKIKNTPELNKFIFSFGIIGPCSRREGFYITQKIRSDTDFYLISNSINFKKTKKIKTIFKEYFPKELDCSLLYATPSILKKPDLMFFEYSNSGIFLFGKKIKPIKLNKISKFESYRNILYRSCYFFDKLEIIENNIKIKKNIKIKEFYYSYSKVIFAIGEVILLLENKYVASNIKRNNLIKNSNIANKINNLKNEHQIMHKFRYENLIISSKEIKNKIKTAFKMINLTYKLLLNELFNGNVENFKKIHPNFLSSTFGRSSFFIKYVLKYKQIPKKIFLEPFIVFSIKSNNFTNKVNNHKKITQLELNEILIYWRLAPWFYYHI